MKNPTILKDELSLLRSDKSAVVTELRSLSKQIKDVSTELFKLESRRDGVRSEILDETARLDDLRGRAVSVRGELTTLLQDLKNVQSSLDVSKQKNSQEIKLHLGRIKEYENEEKDILSEIARLKNLFDRNSRIYNEHESDRLAKIRSLDINLAEKSSRLDELIEKISKKEDEEKKITKDRLKREDKIRNREKLLEAKEVSVAKREEDLITMSKDMMIVYGRLKELYSKQFPDVDLDKLILNAI